MVDATLAQLLNHIYELEQTKAELTDFIQKHADVLKQALAESDEVLPKTDPK